MVEPVALLLEGRGHRVTRARDAGLASEDDPIVIDYALVDDLVVVTFDPDFRAAIRRRGEGRCLHIHAPERTARERVAEHYHEIVRLFEEERARIVTLPANGPPRA
jgi:predicted nuclease of predicted toxin-antitoxin system